LLPAVEDGILKPTPTVSKLCQNILNADDKAQINLDLTPPLPS